MSAVGIITAVVSAAGTALSAYGMYQQAQAQKKAQEYNADVNRKTADQLRAKGLQDAADKRRQVLRQIRHDEMLFAASGVEISSGSPLHALAAEAGEGALTEHRIKWNAEQQALHYENTGQMLDMSAESTGNAGTILAVGQAASGVGKAYAAKYGSTGYYD